MHASLNLCRLLFLRAHQRNENCCDAFSARGKKTTVRYYLRPLNSISVVSISYNIHLGWRRIGCHVFHAASASCMWLQCTMSYSHAWVCSIVTVDIPYSKSTPRSMRAGAAPVLPGAPLKASASRLKTELASPGTRLTAGRRGWGGGHLLLPHHRCRCSILQSSTAGKSTRLKVATPVFPLPLFPLMWFEQA